MSASHFICVIIGPFFSSVITLEMSSWRLLPLFIPTRARPAPYSWRWDLMKGGPYLGSGLLICHRLVCLYRGSHRPLSDVRPLDLLIGLQGGDRWCTSGCWGWLEDAPSVKCIRWHQSHVLQLYKQLWIWQSFKVQHWLFVCTHIIWLLLVLLFQLSYLWKNLPFILLFTSYRVWFWHQAASNWLCWCLKRLWKLQQDVTSITLHFLYCLIIYLIGWSRHWRNTSTGFNAIVVFAHTVHVSRRPGPYGVSAVYTHPAGCEICPMHRAKMPLVGSFKGIVCLFQEDQRPQESGSCSSAPGVSAGN